MKHLIFCFAMMFSCTITAQEQLGLRLENYAGVSSLSLNPTGNLNNPLRWDFNLAGAGLFLENNYFLIRQTNTFDLLKNAENADFLLDKDVEGPVPANTYLIDFFDDGHERFLSMRGYVDGPSLAVRIGEQHSVGAFTRMRHQTGSQEIPNEFSYYKYDAHPFFDSFKVPPFSGATMTWAEIGINYALRLPTNSGSISLGANLKRLIGYEAAYVENFSNWEHTKVKRNTITMERLNGRFGLTTSNLDGNGIGPVRNGAGFGFDLGATLTLDEYEDTYKWRIGASILDIGSIKFDRNAQAHRVNSDSIVTIVSNDYEHFTRADQVEDVFRLFSEQALGDSSASLINEEFSLTLPSALSLQADYRFSDDFFLNAMLVQRISFGGVGPQRGNLFALTPRFEHRWFSASMPVALYNWQDLRIGLAARFGYLVVGTDNLGSLVGKGDYSGTDLYVALKVNPFQLGEGLLGGGGGKRRFGGRGKVRCYDF